MKIMTKSIYITLLIILIIATAGYAGNDNSNLYAGESREDIDYGLEPSQLTTQEGLKLLSPNIPTAIYKNRIKTTPILMGNGYVMHWMMKDGSIWTKIEYKNNDSIIISYSHQTD